MFLTVGFAFIGAAWLILKTEGELQRKAMGWAKAGIWGLILGITAVSLASPLVSGRIFDKWFSFPSVLYLPVLPILSAVLIGFLWWKLRRLPMKGDRFAWSPFAAATALFALAFAGMAYSFSPYVVPERLAIYEESSAPESLFIILIGTLFVLPAILGYTALAYAIFRGKARDLTYD